MIIALLNTTLASGSVHTFREYACTYVCRFESIMLQNLFLEILFQYVSSMYFCGILNYVTALLEI